MKIPIVSIVIPHYNGEDILRHCLDSIEKSEFPDYEIIVVDNGSTDYSVRMIASEFPDVKLVKSAVNLGYAGGCNLGIRESSLYVSSALCMRI